MMPDGGSGIVYLFLLCALIPLLLVFITASVVFGPTLVKTAAAAKKEIHVGSDSVAFVVYFFGILCILMLLRFLLVTVFVHFV
jgi:hypothetical protein